MNSEQFHDKIVAAVKETFAASDWHSNPFEWEGIPARAEALMVEVVQEALEESRARCFGAPFFICERSSGDDATLAVEIVLFGDPDGDPFASARFNLADAIMQDAETSHEKGCGVSQAIRRLETTIARLKDASAAKGWELE